MKSSASYPVLSSGFILRYGASLLCVFFFALIWQQVLREYELMTAYAWRGVLFLWTFLWAVLFFGESVTLNNVIGAAVRFSMTTILLGFSLGSDTARIPDVRVVVICFKPFCERYYTLSKGGDGGAGPISAATVRERVCA
ncbi:MAG: hypothetical protein EOM14_13200, partial [Clostridia bacterium]|nr:hypothetical protein [Clostridia bacterium]